MRLTKSFFFRIFTVLFITLVLSLSVPTFFMSKQVSNYFEKNAYKKIEHNCLLLRDQIDQYMSTVDSSLHQLANTYVSNASKDDFDSITQLLIQKIPSITQVYIMDTSGMQVYKSSHTNTLGDRSDRVYFQHAIKGESCFSDVIMSRSTNRPIVVHSQPIYDKGEIVGVIGASIDLKFLSTIALDSHLQTANANTYGYIVDSTGIVIGHPVFDFVQNMLDVSYLNPVKSVLLNEKGIDIYEFENIEKFVAYIPSTKTNWGVLFQIPKEEALKDIKTMNRLLMISVISIIIIAIVGIFISSLYIKKPIDKIIKLIGKISKKSTYIENYKVQDNEFGMIENELIGMSKEIRRSYEVLEDSVEKRTFELKSAMEQLELTKQEVEIVNKQLQELSVTDGLTGIPNRRRLDEYTENIWQNSKRNKISLAFLMIDIDKFKQYNDEYGHLEGDECLKTVANKLQSLLYRETDFLARYGGEEFMVVLNNVDKKGVEEVADRLCKGIESLKLANERSTVSPYVTISVGVSLVTKLGTYNLKMAMDKADSMLYLAKEKGRNRYLIDVNNNDLDL